MFSIFNRNILENNQQQQPSTSSSSAAFSSSTAVGTKDEFASSASAPAAKKRKKTASSAGPSFVKSADLKQPKKQRKNQSTKNGAATSCPLETVFKRKSKWDMPNLVATPDFAAVQLSPLASTTIDTLSKLVLGGENEVAKRCMDKVSTAPYVNMLNNVGARNSFVNANVVCTFVSLRVLCGVKSTDEIWPLKIENIIFEQISSERLKISSSLEYRLNSKLPITVVVRWTVPQQHQQLASASTANKKTKKYALQQQEDLHAVRKLWESDGTLAVNFDKLLTTPVPSNFGAATFDPVTCSFVTSSAEVAKYIVRNIHCVIFSLLVLVEILSWAAAVYNTTQFMHPVFFVQIYLSKKCKYTVDTCPIARSMISSLRTRYRCFVVINFV